jgi:nucleoside-diphosphate-sugar epimerase
MTINVQSRRAPESARTWGGYIRTTLDELGSDAPMRMWNGLKVLVTGARGFFGSHAVTRAKEYGAQVYALARQADSGDREVRWLSGDLTDPKAVLALVDQVRPDVVFHLAGQTIGAPGKEFVLPSFRNNLAATVNVLLALAEVGCRRVVVTGSGEEPRSENGEVVAISPYGASKGAEVIYARMFHALYRLPVVIVRPFITYGPRQRPSKLVPSLTLSLIRGESPTVSQPDREADWIYIDDVIDGIVAAGEVPGAEGSTIELGSGNLVSIREIAEQLRQIIDGNAAVRYVKSERSVGMHGRHAELEIARRLLDWHPKTSLHQGLVQTVAWYRSRLDSCPE